MTCAHDWFRYTLDDSTTSHAQKDGLDDRGRPYRDVPMKPASAYAYARSIGSNFEDRVIKAACRGCGALP
jgi:hypothetical protein